MQRRQVMVALASALGLGPVAWWLARSSPASAGESVAFPVQRTDEQWRRILTPAQYGILRKSGTERAFTSALNHEKRTGTFVCAGCGQAVFSSEAKFESGTGWPSFWRPVEGAVETAVDYSWLMVRREVHCARCGSHLGHVFDDGPPPTGLRYCINGLALEFLPGPGVVS